MKGLLLKDFYCVKQYIRSYLFMIAFFCVFAVMMKSPMYIVFMCAVMTLLILFSTLTMDESGGYEFDLCLPIPRKTIVQSKYMFMLIGVALTGILASILGIGISLFSKNDENSWIPALFIVLCFYVIIMSILLPTAFKWNVEKARIIMLVLICIPTILVFLVGDGISALLTDRNVFTILNMGITGIVLGFIIVTIVFVAVSYVVSVKIFQNKEF